MKTNTLFLARCISTIVSLVVLFHSCAKEKEDPHNLTRDYTGSLIFEYSRSFPAIQEIITMELELYKSGDILISQPSGHHYDATAEEPSVVKLRETGDIILTSLSGRYKVIDNEPCVVINANTIIDGNQTIWAWDDENGWVLPTEIPFSLDNPVGSPMNFDFDKALMEDIIGATVPAYLGTVTIKWRLALMPSP